MVCQQYCFDKSKENSCMKCAKSKSLSPIQYNIYYETSMVLLFNLFYRLSLIDYSLSD